MKFLMMRGAALVASALTAFSACASEQIKDPYHPSVNGSPITLMKANMITQALGGRLVDLDVWVGEFVQHDDNMFNQSAKKETFVKDTGKKSGTISSSAAGFKMEATEKGVWSARVEGQVQSNVYHNNSRFNGEEGYLHAKATADFSPALSGRVGVNYDRAYDTQRGENDIYELDQYSATAGVTVRPNPYTGVEVDYTFFMQRRSKDSMKHANYNEHSISVRPYHQVTDNTKVYMQLAGTTADPKASNIQGKRANSSESVSAVIGAAWKYSDAASLYGEIGVKHMSFDDDGNLVQVKGNVTRPVMKAGGELVLGEDWKAAAALSYSLVNAQTSTSASNSNYIESAMLSGMVMYSPGAGRFTAKMTPFVSRSKPSNDVAYTEYGLSFGVTYCVTDWLNASAGYRYSFTDYEAAQGYSRNRVTLGLAGVF